MQGSELAASMPRPGNFRAKTGKPLEIVGRDE
jgi:hypothetical protein